MSSLLGLGPRVRLWLTYMWIFNHPWTRAMAKKCAQIITPTIAPQNSIPSHFKENGVLIVLCRSHTFWECSHVVVSFRLLYTRPWCFDIHKASFNAQYDAVPPRFYGVMKIQQWWFFMGFRARIFPPIFSPYIRGMRGPSFPFFPTFYPLKERSEVPHILIFVSTS